MFVFGVPHWGLFRTLTISARSVKVLLSEIRTVLVSAPLKLSIPGPRMTPELPVIDPIEPGLGFCIRTLPEASTRTWFVYTPWSVALSALNVGGVFFALRELKNET